MIFIEEMVCRYICKDFKSLSIVNSFVFRSQKWVADCFYFNSNLFKQINYKLNGDKAANQDTA